MIRALFKYLVYRMLFRFIWRICLVAAAFAPHQLDISPRED